MFILLVKIDGMYCLVTEQFFTSVKEAKDFAQDHNHTDNKVFEIKPKSH